MRQYLMAAAPDKPIIHVLVGWYCEPWGLLGDGHIITLDDAPDWQAIGAWLFVDPDDEAALAAWERQQRSWRRRS